MLPLPTEQDFAYTEWAQAPAVHRTAAAFLIQGLSDDQVAVRLNCQVQHVKDLMGHAPFAKHVLDTQMEIHLKRCAMKNIDGIALTLETMQGRTCEAANVDEMISVLKEYTNTFRETVRRIPGWAQEGVRRAKTTAALGPNPAADAIVAASLKERMAQA